jgi:DNA-binding Xre family transcriptional regulator
MVVNEEAFKRSAFEHMELYWSNITQIAERVDYIGWLEIMVTTTDGQRYIYNDSDQGIRRLPDPRDMTEEECLQEFGYRLRNIMRCRSMSQDDLAYATGIQQARISNYMRGKMSPGFFNLDKIARALDCPIEDLRVC